MSYGKIYSTYWTDEKIQSVSDHAKLLGCYLLSSPHRNAIGCFRLPAQYIAADLGWDGQMIAESVAELERIGFICRDTHSGWTLIKNLMRYDPPHGYKSAIGALRVARTVPRNLPIYSDLYSQLAPILEAQLQGHPDKLESPIEGASMDHTMPHRSPNPSPIPNPSPNPYPSNGASRPPRASRAGDWQAEFSEFWAAYPIHKGKRAAFLAYGRALKRAQHADILAGAQRYATDPTRKPDFTAHPATWLNQDRWLDETAETAVDRALKAITNGAAHDDYR